jgi:hypothetical protein
MKNYTDYILSVTGTTIVTLMGSIDTSVLSSMVTMVCQLVIAGATAYKIVVDAQNRPKKGDAQ